MRKTFRGAIENALRLFGALEEVIYLRRGSDPDLESLTQMQGEFVNQLEMTGVGDGNGESSLVNLERHEVVTEHQFRRYAADEFGLYVLLAKVEKWTAVTPGKFACALDFGGVIQIFSD